MEATKKSEFTEASKRLYAIRNKVNDVLPIWGKQKDDLTSQDIEIITEYDKMLDHEANSLKIGDKVVYNLDGDNKVLTGIVIDILEHGDIRTDTDGVLCAGQYARIATPAETPQISTESAKTVNVSVEPQNEPREAGKCATKNDKDYEKHTKAISVLNSKLLKLQDEAHKYDDRNRLSRKLYFSDAKRQVRIGEQCTAIKAGLDILHGKKWHELDIYNIVLMSVNPRNDEKDKMLEYAYSGGLYEKHKALIFALDTSLPICKKQIFGAIQMQIAQIA